VRLLCAPHRARCGEPVRTQCRIPKRRKLLLGRALAAREPRYRCSWHPSAVKTCVGNSCKQPAYFSRGIDRRTSLEVLVPRSRKSGATRRCSGPAAPAGELFRQAPRSEHSCRTRAARYKVLYVLGVTDKSVEWRGLSRAYLRALPEDSRLALGVGLRRVQQGLAPRDSKPMPPVGPGVAEIRVRDS
jgi:hypothetical protein